MPKQHQIIVNDRKAVRGLEYESSYFLYGEKNFQVYLTGDLNSTFRLYIHTTLKMMSAS